MTDNPSRTSAPDLSTASAARMHNYLRQGGKDHYPSDRAAAGTLEELVPRIRDLVAQARQHMHASVDRVVRRGVDQVVDLGCGMPQHPHGWGEHPHDTAAAVRAVRTVYVDHDAGVAAHARAALTTPASMFVADDLAVAGVWPRVAQAGHLDTGRPALVLLTNTLDYLPDAVARGLLADLAQTLPEGSTVCVASTVLADVGTAAAHTAAMERAAPSVGWRLRTPDQLAALLPEGLEGAFTASAGVGAYAATALLTVPGRRCSCSRLEFHTAQSGRMTNYLLKGSDNYPADRQAVAAVTDSIPGLARLTRESHVLHRRAVEEALSRGITEFLDLGFAIPAGRLHTTPTHRVTHRGRSPRRTVYVDNHQFVITMGRMMLENASSRIVDADLRERGLLARREITEFLDPSRPAAVLATCVVEYLDDTDARALLEDLAAALDPGSVISVVSLAAPDTERAERLSRVLDAALPGAGWHMRTLDHLTALLPSGLTHRLTPPSLIADADAYVAAVTATVPHL